METWFCCDSGGLEGLHCVCVGWEGCVRVCVLYVCVCVLLTPFYNRHFLSHQVESDDCTLALCLWKAFFWGGDSICVL